MSVAVMREVRLTVEACCNCGVLFGLPEEYQRQRIDDKEYWHCPNGHRQHYTGKSLAEQLVEAKRQTASAREDVRVAMAATAKAREETKRLRRRVEAGVCPHCHRTFVQLARHVKSKHEPPA